MDVKTFKYFNLKPWKHQLKAFLMGRARESFAYLMEMGTGKTKVALDDARWNWYQGNINAVVIVAPKGVYRNWSNKEIPKHFPNNEYTIYTWDTRQTKQELAKQHQITEGKYVSLKIIVINVESFSSKRGTKFISEFIKKHKVMMITDESTSIKHHSSNRTKALLNLGGDCELRRILTGSPITNSPLDIYSQASFLDWQHLGFTSYFSFRARYAVLEEINLRPYKDEQGREQQRKFKQVVGYRRLDELRDKITQFSFRVTKDEALPGLPPKIYQFREVEMTSQQEKIYVSMKKLAVSIINENITSATIALTQLQKLHQILCGFLISDDKIVQQVENNRLAALMEILEETSSKVIIWAHYRESIKQIYNAISDKYGKDTVGHYYGSTTDEEREWVKWQFEDPKSKVRFFVGNPSVGGSGIDLIQGRTVVYFSNSFDLEDRIQSEDRSHRGGQTKSVTYIDLVIPGTVDEKVIKCLSNRVNIAAHINGDTAKDWLI